MGPIYLQVCNQDTDHLSSIQESLGTRKAHSSPLSFKSNLELFQQLLYSYFFYLCQKLAIKL